MLYATVRQRKVFVKKPTQVVRNGVNVDYLTLDMDDEWAQMDRIEGVFTLRYAEDREVKEITVEAPHTFGKPLLVPSECLTQVGWLMFSCAGYVGDEKIMTTMLPDSFWNVVENGPMTGDAPLDASEWPGWSEYELRKR